MFLFTRTFRRITKKVCIFKRYCAETVLLCINQNVKAIYSKKGAGSTEVISKFECIWAFIDNLVSEIAKTVRFLEK